MAFQRNIGDLDLQVDSGGAIFEHFRLLESILGRINAELYMWLGWVEERTLKAVLAIDEETRQLAQKPFDQTVWNEFFKIFDQAEQTPIIISGADYQRCFMPSWQSGYFLTVPFQQDETGWVVFIYHGYRKPLEQLLPIVACWPLLWQAARKGLTPVDANSLAPKISFPEAATWLENCSSPQMSHMVNLAKRVAMSETAVLVSGETGTGKGVLAKALHAWSRRAGNTFLSVNCATLKAELVESELFGHVRGAFTGAEKDRQGRFQAAHGGTLFLDEIGELSLDLQAKLLRVLQEGEFEPLGSNQTLRVDVRLICATNQDLKTAVGKGSFREDLYFRLAVFPIHVPPLRERMEDLPVITESLVGHWLQEGLFDWKPPLCESDFRLLQASSWPGNIRQLGNVLKRSMVAAGNPEQWRLLTSAIEKFDDLDQQAGHTTFPTMLEAEKTHIASALKTTGGRLYGPQGAAKLLGLHPSTLRGRMRKLGMGGAKQFK